MSRGLGKVEKAIIDCLKDQIADGMPGCLSIPGLVAFIYGQTSFAMALHQPFSKEEKYASVKRATKSLEKKGLVKRHTRAHGSRVMLIKCNSPRDTLREWREGKLVQFTKSELEKLEVGEELSDQEREILFHGEGA